MNNMDDLRDMLRRAAEALTRVTPESAAAAEAALTEALACARSLVSSSDASNWPTQELALCRSLVSNANLFWEGRRLVFPADRITHRTWVA